MKNREVLFLLPTLEKFAVEREDVPSHLAAKIAVRLVRLRTTFDAIDRERQALQKSLAKQADGKPVIEDNRFVFVDPDAANEALNELLDEETKVDMPAPLTVDSLPEEFEISSAVMAAFLTLGVFSADA